MKTKYEVRGGILNEMDNSQYEKNLWIQWKQHQNITLANQLIAYYMHIVDYQVERIASYIPATFDKGDLKSLGLMGLYDALYKFEPSRNVKFTTYASIRVHGSIMDGLRKEDWLPRALRDKAKKVEKVSEQLEQQLNRTPTAIDIAKVLQIEVEEVEMIRKDAMMANIQSLDARFQTDETDEGAHPLLFMDDEKLPTPDEQMIFNEIKEELVQSIKQLNKQEQLVISLVYIEELTLTEIGDILELTTSRISQIHKKAIHQLKFILSKLEEDRTKVR